MFPRLRTARLHGARCTNWPNVRWSEVALELGEYKQQDESPRLSRQRVELPAEVFSEHLQHPSVNQSTDQSTNQPTNQPVSRSIKSLSQSINQSTRKNAAELTAKGRIAAGTNRIRLRMSTTHWIFTIGLLYNGPPKCPFVFPPNTWFFWIHPSPNLRRHLDRFIRFSTAHGEARAYVSYELYFWNHTHVF